MLSFYLDLKISSSLRNNAMTASIFANKWNPLEFHSEEDLTESLEAAMDKYPDAYAVLVKRHGV